MNHQRIDALKQFIQDEPDNPFNRYALAMEYYEGQPEVAINLLEELVQSHPDYLPTYFKLAHLLWELEQWDKADQCFSNGITLANQLGDQKALSELKSAYQNFQFEKD